ncbi:MAG TPA: hypothetical protein VGG56_17015 [Terracidiphilus sp.]
MRRSLIVVAAFLLCSFLLCSFAWSQTPTLVQSVWGENSLSYDTAGWPGNPPLYYAIEFPEPTQAGNLLVCSAFGGSGITLTISDDKSESWSTGGSNFPFRDSNNNTEFIWYMANNGGGVRQVKVSSTTNPGFVSVTCSEFYNVAMSSALDGTANCRTASGTTPTGTATGALTNGDLIYFVSYGNAAASSSFTAGSQSNIGWVLDAVDLLDGYAVQHGVYSSTSSFTPQMTTGSGGSYTSCQAAFKSAAAGTAPTQAMRIVHLGHFSMPDSGTTQNIQMPSSGNLLVASFTAGGDSISSITSSPGNTWSSTGTVSGGPSLNASSQIYYAANASTATTLTAAITRSGSLSNDNVLIYDITGANPSPFDKDSGGLSGTQSSQVSSFTSCSNCLTPSGPGELVILNANQDWCTGTAVTAPSGALYDSAFTTMDSVNGAQPVDQNGEWAHLYTTGTSAISATWTMSCDEAELGWAGRVAAFKDGPQTQPMPPTGVKASAVAQ